MDIYWENLDVATLAEFCNNNKSTVARDKETININQLQQHNAIVLE